MKKKEGGGGEEEKTTSGKKKWKEKEMEKKRKENKTDYYTNHVEVTIERFHATEQFPVVPAVDEHLRVRSHSIVQ
jgi:hypothetical protein